MNEIKKCSIAGVSFTLEKNAYHSLQTYIKSLNDTYKDNPDGEEIVADIEARIAELILSAQPAEAIITPPTIENIIKQLGSAEQIEDDGTEHHAETFDQNGNPRIPRRLYRDLQNGKLGGVCAGIANYFDVDSTWIRLALFIPLALTIFGSVDILHWMAPFSGNLFGFVIIGYIIMWFTIPAASSARQKLEMKGERITAHNIHATHTAAPDERERTLLAKVIVAAGNLLLIILKVVALFFLIGLVTGVSVLGFVAIVTIPALLSTDLFTGLAIASLFVVLMIPILVLIYLSVMLLVSRRPSGKTLLVIFLIWLISLISMTISAIKSPVEFDDQIENTFESVFENDSKILYEEFSKQEVDEFRKQMSNMDISTKQKGDIILTLQGSSENIEKIEATLKIDENGVTISDKDGKLVEVTPNGIKIDGKEFIDYTTETIQSASGSTKAFIFSVGDVKVRFEKDLSEAIEKQKEANKQQEKLNNEARKAMKNI